MEGSGQCRCQVSEIVITKADTASVLFFLEMCGMEVLWELSEKTSHLYVPYVPGVSEVAS